jgi:hypothetical protein
LPSIQCSPHSRRTVPAVGLVRWVTFTVSVQEVTVAVGGMFDRLNAMNVR